MLNGGKTDRGEGYEGSGDEEGGEAVGDGGDSGGG